MTPQDDISSASALSSRPEIAAADRQPGRAARLSSAEIGAMAHLYRAEVYRSTTWRTRLDATTNWSVVSLGVALSITYAQPEDSALPLVFTGALLILFLILESRRYRYFNVWRARARWLETHFYAPMLRGESYEPADGWGATLAEDYLHPEYHVSYFRAIGRRLRRNYLWVFWVQGLAYFGKASIHPTPAVDRAEFLERVAIGPLHGWSVIILAIVFYGGLSLYTLVTWRLDRSKHGDVRSRTTIG